MSMPFDRAVERENAIVAAPLASDVPLELLEVYSRFAPAMVETELYTGHSYPIPQMRYCVAVFVVVDV